MARSMRTKGLQAWLPVMGGPDRNDRLGLPFIVGLVCYGDPEQRPGRLFARVAQCTFHSAPGQARAEVRKQKQRQRSNEATISPSSLKKGNKFRNFIRLFLVIR